MAEHGAYISDDQRPMKEMLETDFFFRAKDCTELRRLHLAMLLLFASTGVGCRMVLPNCSPSQLWPVYAAQQEAKAYQEQFGNCPLEGACATPGDPQSDFRMGFRDGYLHEVSQRYNFHLDRVRLGVGVGSESTMPIPPARPTSKGSSRDLLQARMQTLERSPSAEWRCALQGSSSFYLLLPLDLERGP